MTDSSSRRWLTLGIVGAAFFMTILDVSIVNVALPSIGKDLHVSDKSLQWVITAYAITYGGFLLLGGRSADLLGRRRVFLVGLTLFTTASLACGLAGSLGVLIGARAVQGLGAAIISPAALSIVTTAFEEGADRNKALGIWGALGGSGAAVGVLAGGVITKWLGWSWIFFVNVPVGIAVFVLCVLFVAESRAEVAKRRYDPLGALLATGSLVMLVYAISKAPDVGWGSAQTIGLLIGAAVGSIAFFAVERRVEAPLLPLPLLRVRTVFGANVVGLLLGAVIFGNFFILTLYVQQVLGFSALKTGYTFLATAGTTVLWAGVSQALVTKVGARPIMTLGLSAMGVALILYTHAPWNGHFLGDLLPGYLLFALGIAFAFVPVSIAALAGVPSNEAGIASGLINTNQQIGGAIGVALASTVATSRFTNLVHEGVAAPAAFTQGFHRAFWMLAILAFVGAVVAVLLVRDREIAAAHEGEPARAAGGF
jgi:EmrB/QacA subfamily drug resistance transporter